MSKYLRSRAVGCLLTMALAAIAIAPAANAAQTDPVIQAPVADGTYLALGDSLAFGYQRAKVLACAGTGCTTPDTLFSTGYVNDYATTFGVSGVNTVNLGCPGETSSSLLNDTNGTTGCTTYPFAIHSNHPGKTQIQAAVDVLQSIGKRVSPITIDIGANDVLGAVNGCTTTSGDPPVTTISLSCVQAAAPAVFATINANLDTTLATLRQEGGVKHEIIVMGLYNVLYPAIFQQTLAQTGSFTAAAAAGAASDQLATTLNSLQAATAAKYRAVFADPFPVFNPQGNPIAEINSICAKTAVCGPLRDIHPTDSGYTDLANVIAAADGF